MSKDNTFPIPEGTLFICKLCLSPVYKAAVDLHRGQHIRAEDFRGAGKNPDPKPFDTTQCYTCRAYFDLNNFYYQKPGGSLCQYHSSL